MSNSYIGYSELTDVYININNGAFQVTDDGNIYGSIAYLGYNALWATKVREEQYNVIVGSADGFIFKIFDPSNEHHKMSCLVLIPMAMFIYLVPKANMLL